MSERRTFVDHADAEDAGVMRHRRRVAIALSLTSCLASLASLLPGLDAIGTPYWDEGHYLSDALCFLDPSAGLTNPEHPPLGKWLLAQSIRILGETPFGYRMVSLVATALLVGILPLGVHAARLLPSTSHPLLLGLPSALLLLDPMTFVLGRVAMLDAPLALFLTSSTLLFVASLERDDVRLGAVAGALGGLALAVKWTALVLVPVYVLGFLAVRGRHVHFRPRPFLATVAPFVVVYVACFALPGALRFAPEAFHLTLGPLDESQPFLLRVIDLHVKAVGYHVAYFTSEWATPWYQWWTGTGAIWFAAREADAGLRVVVACVSVPLLFVGIPSGALTSVRAVARRDRVRLVLLAVPVAELLLWAVAPRMSFLYYTGAIVPFVAVFVGDLLATLDARRTRVATVALLVACGLWFARVAPLIRGEVVADETLRDRGAAVDARFVFHPRFPAERMLALGHGGEFLGARLRRPAPRASVSDEARRDRPNAGSSSR